MHYWRDNHGIIYGPFNKQEDGFPNAGEVVRSYREKMKLSQGALAVLLGVDRTWVNKMENENAVPELLSRRHAIARFLNIPPVLLGISVIGSDMFLMPLEEAHSHTSVSTYSVQEATEYLAAVWGVYRLTNPSDLLPGARRWKAKIKERVNCGGAELKRNLELLLQYENLLLRIGRELNDYTETDPKGLVDLAEQIDTPDTRGISLYRRGKMYFEHQNHKEAIDDIKAALDQVEHASPHVKGLVLISCGPVLAHDATTKDDVQKVMKNLDKAWKCVDKSKGSQDVFYTGFGESGYYVDRAYSIIPLLRLDPTLITEVWEVLDLARGKTAQKYIPPHPSIELLYSEAAFYAGNYLSSVSAAFDALELARSFDSERIIERIKKLYNKLAQTEVKGTPELRELRVALLKK